MFIFTIVLICTLIVFVISYAFAVIYWYLLFVWKKITTFIETIKHISYDKVFHSISKVPKRERQRKN